MPEQQYSALENLLNDLISNSSMDKSFLFDVVSKIYIATDSNPVDMQSYELCSDMIDVVIDVSCIYGLQVYCSRCCFIKVARATFCGEKMMPHMYFNFPTFQCPSPEFSPLPFLTAHFTTDRFSIDNPTATFPCTHPLMLVPTGPAAHHHCE